MREKLKIKKKNGWKIEREKKKQAKNVEKSRK